MTVIKSISAKGFKSFAKSTEIIFGDGFNCIIGPNGSGKSNVMDLMTFVLGKISAKSMRAEKSSNLIYNGGKDKNPAREAIATIVFNNSNKKFPINDKQVKISRIIRQKGNSIYKMNDKTVNRHQILELLNTAGIDPDGHNIVL
ncbi:AAA family ATPase, partial [archaeon]|nr:AAA family ATPase [archaeon]